jgi:hypothetical protein
MANAKAIKPIAGWDVIVHRGGFGVLLLKHLPGFPGTNVSEEEAARAIATAPFALKPEQCEELANDLYALAEQLRAQARPVIGRRARQAKPLHS